MSNLFNRLQDEIDSQNEPGGLSPADLLDMSKEMAAVIRHIVRQNGMNLIDIAQSLGKSEEETQEALDELVSKGFVRKVEVKSEIWYKAKFARKRGSQLGSGVWSALDSAIEAESSDD